ncbi:MAG: hypothetical protein H0W88_02445 [Parachlamydiaceae bacterium]|nr:hypothetical protein [Parachlamydiaceae bacterium]
MFKKMLFIAVCCFLNQLSADTIGNIEYNLPKTEHGWKLDSTKTESSGTVVKFYLPDPLLENQSPEFFGATYNKSPGGAHNKDSLIALLKEKYPNNEVHVDIIEKLPDSILYEWSVGKPSQQGGIHGWTRIFSVAQGTITLGYITQKSPNQIEKLRPIWIQTLKDAKKLQNETLLKS